MCSKKLDRHAGVVAIYVTQTETIEDLGSRITTQNYNGEYAAIRVFEYGIVIITMYLLPILSSQNYKSFIDVALVQYGK